MMTLAFACSLFGLIAYFFYVKIAYVLLRAYVKLPSDMAFSWLLDDVMFLVLVSTFPMLLAIWILDKIISMFGG